MVGQLPERMPDDVRGGRAGLGALRFKQAADQAGIGLVLGPGGPERLTEVMFIGRVSRVEPADPGLDRRQHFLGGMRPEFAAGPVAGAVFRLLEVLQQFRH